MKHKLLTILSAILPLSALSQSISLDECRSLARDNYPAIKQYGLIEQVKQINVANADKAWLPQVGVSAGATAFTDVLKNNARTQAMGVDMKNYAASGEVSVNQSVYDGGQIAANKRIACAQAEVDKRRNDITMYGVYEQVEQAYFAVLALDKQIEQTRLLQSDLQLSRKNVESLVKGGLANESDVDAVAVEQVKAAQQLESLGATRNASLQVLSTLIGKQLGGTTQLQLPDCSQQADGGFGKARPEYAIYDAQDRLLDEQRKALDARLRPTVGLFGMGMVHTSVTPLARNGLLLGGITLKWNIGALYTRKNDIAKLQLQRNGNNVAREAFLFNVRLQNENVNGSIASLRKQIEQDDEIVRLRERIRSKSQKKVELGTESVNEMLRDVIAVSQARLQKAIHQVQLAKEYYRLKNINND